MPNDDHLPASYVAARNALRDDLVTAFADADLRVKRMLVHGAPHEGFAGELAVVVAHTVARLDDLTRRADEHLRAHVERSPDA